MIYNVQKKKLIVGGKQRKGLYELAAIHCCKVHWFNVFHSIADKAKRKLRLKSNIHWNVAPIICLST